MRVVDTNLSLLTWKTRLFAIDTALWLSQRRIGVVKEICSSVSSVEIQDSSLEVWTKLLHSASVLEEAITSCFRDHQDIKLGPIKLAAPEVDHWSSTSNGQSASQKA